MARHRARGRSGNRPRRAGRTVTARDARRPARLQRRRDARRLAAFGSASAVTRQGATRLADPTCASGEVRADEAGGLLPHRRPHRARVSATGCAWPLERIAGEKSAHRHRDRAQRARFAGRARGARPRLLRRADHARHGELSRSPASRLRHFEHFVRALAFVKKAAAPANGELGVLDAAKSRTPSRRPATKSSPASCTTSSSST